MNNLLITGGAGFIGSNFIKHFLKEYSDCFIVNLDKLTYAGNLSNLKAVENDENYIFVRGSICNKELLDYVFSKYRIDYVINFASESHVDRSILGPEIFVETNVKGTQILLDLARNHTVKMFVQISTDEVYGELGETGYFTEETPLAPNSPYSASKASADMLCRAYFRTYDLGWNPEYSFEKGIEETIEWYVNNTKWVENCISGEYVKYYQQNYGGRYVETDSCR